MRRSILLPVALAGACEGGAGGYSVIEDFAARATPVRCEAVALAGGPSPTELRLATDSTWTVLDAAQRQVLEYDDDLRLRARTEIPAAGPGAAEHPVSVAALGDTAWAVAARGGLRLVLLSRAGRELGVVPLDFIPHSVEPTTGGELLLTAMPFGDRPPTLLVRWDGRALTPVDVPPRRYDDMTVNALANTALVETFPDGAALVVHQFMEPRAFRIGPDGEVAVLAAPTPDGTRDRIAFVPRSPITDDQMPRTLLPAMAMSVDPGRREVYVMTRSGRETGGRPERAVLRLADDLAFLDGFTLDVHGVGLVYLPRRGVAVVTDDQDRFYRCPLDTGARHARAD